MRTETYKVPREDKSIFVKPELEEIPALIEENKRKLEKFSFNVGGIDFQELRAIARKESLEGAAAYTKGMGLDVRIASDETVIETGHQPTLHHPGVWIKNHLTHFLASKAGGVGLNIVVDNDACHDNALAIPFVSNVSVAKELIPFVGEYLDVAFEELPVQERADHERFREAALAKLDQEGMRQTFLKFMGLVRKNVEGARNLGELYTFARRQFEDDFGLANIEIPISLVSETDGFLIFFLQVIFNIERFAQSYNGRLEQFRKLKKIRSKANPLPNLKVDGDLIETPFWAWRKGEPRGRLFAEVGKDHVRLWYAGARSASNVKGEHIITFESDNETNLRAVVPQLREAVRGGIKIRPRALTNTIFARLFVCDCFIHGIGGANYDIITDEIIKDFYRIDPPGYITVSATLYLPFETYNVQPSDVWRQKNLIRDHHWNADRHLTPELENDKDMQAMKSVKWQLIPKKGETREERSAVFYRLRELNRLMSDKVGGEIAEAEAKLEDIQEKLRRNAVLRSRDYAFCIHPEDSLKEFYDPDVRFSS